MSRNKIENRELINQIINHMETGTIINSTGESRKFDVVDFYLMAKMGYKSFLKLVEKNYASKYHIVDKYFKQNHEYLNGTKLQNSVIEMFFCYRDHVITDEEKMQIIKFLSDNEMPINVATYFYTARKYVDGIIDFEKTKVKVKKKTNKLS